MAEKVKKKLQDAEKMYEQLEQQKLQVHNAQQQLVGRIQTYKELLEEEELPTEAVEEDK